MDLVTGPDAYRDLPRLLGLVGAAGRGESAGAVNVQVRAQPCVACLYGRTRRAMVDCLEYVLLPADFEVGMMRR